jgi:periplasmic divalent cation tolerance protein
MNVLVLFVTAPSMSVAKTLARSLVTQKLVACVNIVPGVQSVYTWEGRVQEDEEVLMIVKTVREQFEQVKRAVISEHPYDVPEVIGLEVKEGSEPYLDWVRSQCSNNRSTG